MSATIDIQRPTHRRARIDADAVTVLIEAGAPPVDWRVDLAGERLHIHRDPRPDGYATVIAQGWAAAARSAFLPGVTLVLADILSE